MKNYVLRLQPGQDLKQELLSFCKTQSVKAGFVLSGIGSLKKINLRLANSKKFLQNDEFYEILSLQGSLTETAVHIHICVADSNGDCFGGHLMDGCEIFTTAEIFIGELEEKIFSRELDIKTGYPELIIKNR